MASPTKNKTSSCELRVKRRLHKCTDFCAVTERYRQGVNTNTLIGCIHGADRRRDCRSDRRGDDRSDDRPVYIRPSNASDYIRERDVMWVSHLCGSERTICGFRPTTTSFRSIIARYLPSSRHRAVVSVIH